MSTGIQKELINVENMTVTTKITSTKRKLLTTNVEKDNNNEISDFKDDIDREIDDIESESESS